MTVPTLRPYQRQFLDAIEAALATGKNRLLGQAPTGTGKTVTFAAIPDHFAPWLSKFPYGKRTMFVLAHREELLDQAADKISKANPGLTVMIEQGDRVASPYSDVIIASVQTLSSRDYARLKRLLSHGIVPRVVIVDEAHHSAADTYRTCLAYMGFLPLVEVVEEDGRKRKLAMPYDDVKVMEQELAVWDAVAPQDRLLVGMTATPNRSDNIGLSCVYQDLVFSYRLRQAIQDGWLVPIVPYIVETADNLDTVKTTAGDFNQRQLADTVNNEARNKLAVKGWMERGQGRPTLTFTVDVQHAHDLAKTFVDAGVNAVALSGETPKEDRRIMLRQYMEGQITMICNCMVLTEGTDLPLTGCILHAKPTKSATLYEQMTGRGLRLHETKTDCIVIDVVDIARRHSLQTTPSLYGLPPIKGDGETLDQMADEFDELRKKLGDLSEFYGEKKLSLADVRAHITTFDIWGVPDLGPFAQHVKLEWGRGSGEDAYVLRYPWQDGQETLQVSKDMLGKWEITTTLVPKDGSARRNATIAHGITEQSAAATMAEAFVAQYRRDVHRLSDPNAAWRKDAPTDKQLRALRAFRVPHNEKTLTKGEAKRLLDIAFANKRRF